MTRDEAIAGLTAPGKPFEIRERVVGGVPMSVYARTYRSLRDVLLFARSNYGAREFIVYGDERWTYEEHFRRVAALAHLLTDRGVRKGDRVAIGMRNYPEWLMSFWACQAIGAVVVTLNAWWTGHELRYALLDCGARTAILDGERLQRLEGLLSALPLTTVLGVRDAVSAAGVELLDTVLAPYESEPGLTRRLPDVRIDTDDVATIMYTSGTTDSPKGAVASHRNHITNLNNVLLSATAAVQVAGRAREHIPITVELQTFPFFHIGGLTGVYTLPALGARIALMYRWDTSEALRLMERECVNHVSGVPTVVRALLERAVTQGLELPALGGITAGGAPVPPGLVHAIGSQFAKRVAPRNNYGLTETSSSVISNDGADYFARPDSVGRPVPVAEVRVVGEDGRTLGSGAIGELWIRGPNVVLGYWEKPEATAAAFTDGWFRSGDLGYRDAAGFYYVVDRKKDVIIRGGENVYCAEVEAVLYEHPQVADVAIIGVPHRELGEEVAAVIESRPGVTLDDKDIQAFVAARLARFKVPSRIFETADPLPRTASGKVQKHLLKTRYAV